MRNILSPDFDKCPFCASIEQNGFSGGCAFYHDGKSYEGILRFCSICGKEYLSYDEWYKKQIELKEEQEAFLKEYQKEESQD